MRSRIGRVVQLYVMLVLMPALAFAQEQREPSDTETGPRGLACKDAAAALRRATFALSVGRVTLRDGKACVPTGVASPPCEWAVELTRIERWGDGSSQLIAVVNADHRAGSGAWDSVFFYACRNDVLVQTHARRYLYGARISVGGEGHQVPDPGSRVPLNRSELLITSGDWQKSDPACCASRERREYFGWSDATGKVVLKRTEIVDPVKR